MAGEGSFTKPKWLAAEILRGPFGLEMPSFQRAHIEETALTTITPTSFRADLVVTLQRDETVPGIVVEVQLAIEKSKPTSWLVYLANLYAKIQAPVVLLVIAGSERVAEWCARPLLYGPGDFTLRPRSGRTMSLWLRTKPRLQKHASSRCYRLWHTPKARMPSPSVERRCMPLAVTNEASARIMACADIALLDAWIRRAATATKLDEVFEL